jgi:hypothetical protein
MSEVGARAKLFKDPAGGVELHLSGIHVPQIARGETDQDAHARAFVHGLHLLPRGPSLAQL